MTMKEMTDTCKKCVIKDWCDMVVENGKIIEMTEDELFRMYLDRDMYLCMDFIEYKTRMVAAGTKVVEEGESSGWCKGLSSAGKTV